MGKSIHILLNLYLCKTCKLALISSDEMIKLSYAQNAKVLYLFGHGHEHAPS